MDFECKNPQMEYTQTSRLAKEMQILLLFLHFHIIFKHRISKRANLFSKGKKKKFIIHHRNEKLKIKIERHNFSREGQ